MALFSADDRAWLRAPHVGRAWFGEIETPSGTTYLHNGVGRITVGEQEYRGVSDPLGQLVDISDIEDQRFGQAAKIDVVIAGVSAESFKQWKEYAREIEGLSATIRFGVFDPETLNIRMFKQMVPGKVSSAKLFRKGVAERYIGVAIEGFWQSMNYPFGGKWSPGDFRQRNSGAKGMDFIGVTVSEVWS